MGVKLGSYDKEFAWFVLILRPPGPLWDLPNIVSQAIAQFLLMPCVARNVGLGRDASGIRGG